MYQSHDKIWYLRHTFLFLLPLILHFLPYSSASQSPFTLLHPIAIHLERIHARLSLYSLVHSAAQRNPELRNNAGQYWETMEKESTLGRESRDVKTEAERLGMGFEEKANGKAERRWKVREEAGNIVDNMVEVLKGLKAVMGQRPPPAPSPPTDNGDSVDEGR